MDNHKLFNAATELIGQGYIEQAESILAFLVVFKKYRNLSVAAYTLADNLHEKRWLRNAHKRNARRVLVPKEERSTESFESFCAEISQIWEEQDKEAEERVSVFKSQLEDVLF